MLEKKFNNEDLGIELTSYIDKQQNVWFRGKDVATILGYSKPENAIERHVSKNHKIRQIIWYPVSGSQAQNLKSCPVETTGQGRWCTLIDEAVFYELVFSSKLKAAKKFRDWVFTTVLPSIRKYGFYKLLKIENKNILKQRVLIGGKKYYKHPVFSNYAASKNGDIVSLKTKRIMSKNNIRGHLGFKICDKKFEKPKIYLQHRFIYEVFKGVIPSCLEIDHINNCKTDNRIKNLQLLTHKQNVGKSRNKPIISTCIENGKKKVFISIKKEAFELEIYYTNITQICKKKGKSATSKKDGKKYTFEYLR